MATTTQAGRPPAAARRSRGREALSALLGAAGGGGAALALYWLGGAAALVPPLVREGGAAGALLWFGQIAPALLAALAVHEGGHALAGRLVGFRLLVLAAGPVRLVRGGRGLRLGWNRLPAHFGGVCLSAPRRWRGTEAFRRAYTVFVAGGPAASLAAGAAGLALYAARAAGGAPAAPWAPALAFGAMASLAVGVVSLVPLQSAGGLVSDGMRLRRLRRPTPADRLHLHAQALILLAHTQRPREWDPSLVERAAEAEADPDFGSAVATLAYYHALDLGRPGAAARWLARALGHPGTTPPTRAALALEAAAFEALWQGDLEAARRWLAQGEAARGRDPQGWHLARAAIHHAEGDPAGAAAALARAAEAARRDGGALPRLAVLDRLARPAA